MPLRVTAELDRYARCSLGLFPGPQHVARRPLAGVLARPGPHLRRQRGHGEHLATLDERHQPLALVQVVVVNGVQDLQRLHDPASKRLHLAVQAHQLVGGFAHSPCCQAVHRRCLGRHLRAVPVCVPGAQALHHPALRHGGHNPSLNLTRKGGRQCLVCHGSSRALAGKLAQTLCALRHATSCRADCLASISGWCAGSSSGRRSVTASASAPRASSTLARSCSGYGPCHSRSLWFSFTHALRKLASTGHAQSATSAAPWSAQWRHSCQNVFRRCCGVGLVTSSAGTFSSTHRRLSAVPAHRWRGQAMQPSPSRSPSRFTTTHATANPSPCRPMLSTSNTMNLSITILSFLVAGA